MSFIRVPQTAYSRCWLKGESHDDDIQREGSDEEERQERDDKEEEL